ncbi:MAG: menaquinone reductase multiheme cytochrome c subunit QrcA [Desulfovibrionaceae bacterium]
MMDKINNKLATMKGSLPFVAGILAALIAGWVIFPEFLYSKKSQPINFDHKKHVEEIGLSCNSCHFTGENGSFSGIPPTSACASCHSTPQGDSAEEARMIAEYIEPGKEIEWIVYNKQPDNVSFSHDAHSLETCNTCHDFKQEQLCGMCHLPVWTMETLPDVRVNKLTGYTDFSQTMDSCESCHANENHRDGQTNANNSCFTCHK